MSLAKKVVLISARSKNLSQFGSGNEENENSGVLSSSFEPKKDRIKAKIYDKIHRFIKIILKLARSVGYDNDLRIKLKDGQYLEKSNIVDLLTHAMSSGKVLYGEQEFIELLFKCDVDPDLIINENVKNKLIQLKNKGKVFNDVESNTNNNISEEKLKRPSKRKSDLTEDNLNIQSKKRRIDDDLIDKQSMNEEVNQIKSVTAKRNKRKISDISSEEIEDKDIDTESWEIPE